jgi:hypothetical protein
MTSKCNKKNNCKSIRKIMAAEVFAAQHLEFWTAGN